MLQVHEKRIYLPHGGKITLFVFGDLQFGVKGFDAEMWQQFKHDFKSTKNAYAIGLGDYDDWLRWTSRIQLVRATADDRSTRERLDDMVMEATEKIARELEFLNGRVVGMHSGHHEWDFLDGTNTSQVLCKKLGAPYLYWTAYTVLKFHSKKTGGNAASLKIFSTHGSGGSMFSSADLGNLEKKIAPYWVADLYLRGHSSKLEMIPMELNDVTLRGPIPRAIKKTRWLVNCGGFMGGYADGPASYVERCNMPPACLGWAKCEIQFSTNVHDLNGDNITGLKIQPTLCSPRTITME